MRGLEAVGLGLNLASCLTLVTSLHPTSLSFLSLLEPSPGPWAGQLLLLHTPRTSVFLLCLWPHCVGTVRVRILQPWKLPEGHH